MRIALVQMRIDFESRASNLSRALRWIDRACAEDPAPDLVVLPAGCDGAAFGPGRPTVSVAMAQVFSQSVALRAKEWGTYIALGFHQPPGQPCDSLGVVYDPDGDTIATVCVTPVGDDAAGLPSQLTVTQTPLGCWSLLLADPPWEDDLSRRTRDAGARLAVVLAGTTSGPGVPFPARCQQLARDAGTHVCLAVGLSEGREAPVCHVWDAAGTVLSQGTHGVEECIGATVALGPGLARPATRRGGGADAPTA
jgi:hypothetical protein